MPKFKVKLRVKTTHIVEVEAADAHSAEDLVGDQFDDCKLELGTKTRISEEMDFVGRATRVEG